MVAYWNWIILAIVIHIGRQISSFSNLSKSFRPWADHCSIVWCTDKAVCVLVQVWLILIKLYKLVRTLIIFKTWNILKLWIMILLWSFCVFRYQPTGLHIINLAEVGFDDFFLLYCLSCQIQDHKILFVLKWLFAKKRFGFLFSHFLELNKEIKLIFHNSKIWLFHIIYYY